MNRIGANLAMLLMAGSAAAAGVEGELVLRWGDEVQQGERLQADLVLASHSVLALDADSLRAATDDLVDLDGRRVRVQLDGLKSGAGQAVAAVAALDAPARSKSAGRVDRPWVTLLCKFADVAAEPRSRAHIEAVIGAQGWMGDYWAEQSGGRTDFSANQVVGWVALPHARSHYVQPGQYARLDRLFNDCTAAAAAEVDFLAGGAGIAGINLLFNAALDCCAWGGGIHATLQGVTQRWAATWNPPFAYLDPAALAHEMGHAYGLPHANTSDGDNQTYDNPWDLMSDPIGHAVRDHVFGRLPKRLGAHQRARLGWIEPARLARVEVDGRYRFRIEAPGAGDGIELVELRHPDWPAERWLSIETRDRNDPQDAALPATAVIVHEVDTRRSQPAWVVDSNDPVADYSNTAGSIFGAGRELRDAGGEFVLRVLQRLDSGFEVELNVTRPIFASRFGE